MRQVGDVACERQGSQVETNDDVTAASVALNLCVTRNFLFNLFQRHCPMRNHRTLHNSQEAVTTLVSMVSFPGFAVSAGRIFLMGFADTLLATIT